MPFFVSLSNSKALMATTAAMMVMMAMMAREVGLATTIMSTTATAIRTSIFDVNLWLLCQAAKQDFGQK